jgi:hypothetical protein
MSRFGFITPPGTSVRSKQMGYFKCVQNRDGKVVIVHALGRDGKKLGRITFDDNERFAERQVEEGDVGTINYSFSKVDPSVADLLNFPEA